MYSSKQSIRVYMWPFSKRKEKHNLHASPTPEMVAEAKRHPSGWVYQIDGKLGPNETVPPDRIVGAYKVDENGNLTGEFQANPKYRES
jgi:hypothetical protein